MKEEDTERCYGIALKETVTLQKGEQQLVAGELVKPEMATTSESILLKPSQHFIETYGVLLADSEVDTNQDWIPLRVMNLNSRPVTLPRGSIAATCAVVEEKSVSPEQPRTSNQREPGECSMGEIPEHLAELWERSSWRLNELQKQKLSIFLKKYEKVFATSPEDLGRTGIVNHTIDTDDSRPIRQRPRRLPLQ